MPKMLRSHTLSTPLLGFSNSVQAMAEMNNLFHSDYDDDAKKLVSYLSELYGLDYAKQYVRLSHIDPSYSTNSTRYSSITGLASTSRAI